MPDWKAEVHTRLASLNLSPTREAEIVDELSQHLDDRYRESIAGGASPEDATRLALAAFQNGNVLAQQMASLRQAHASPPITPAAPTGHLFSDRLAGPPLRHTDIQKAAGLRRDRRPDAGARDRRHDGDFQRGLRRVVEATALS